MVGKIGTLLKSALDAAAGRGWTDLLREAIHDDGLPEGIRNHAQTQMHTALDAAAGIGRTDLLREAIHDDGSPEGIRTYALDAAAGIGRTDLLREAIHDDGLPEGIRNHAKVALQEVTTRPDPKEVVGTYLAQFVSNVAGGWDNRTRERVACAFPEHYGPRVEHYRQPGRAGPFQAVFPSRLSR
ncbi:hypothetical protein COX84_02660 [Candidatus Micrarchaeota archaeon CG_4_10_14_0_2_um_filter_49_7]|nr:MAG: hypothetical protein COX84_02660 [Candidatus Micrarchaeota archaeon CG_4_10_14_0_2_um_filter_49_7]